jgi:hypothetical protein
MTTIAAPNHPPAASRLDSVQALRAIAAIAVVTHHVTLFENGEWGVDLFFAPSQDADRSAAASNRRADTPGAAPCRRRERALGAD